MKRNRRKHSAEFKVRVALETIKGMKTVSEIVKEFEIHPVMVGKWKNEMLDRMSELFETKNKKAEKESEQEQEILHRKVGQLTMEVDFLEKSANSWEYP